jgi:AhpD family alkylhydroperoxidase
MKSRLNPFTVAPDLTKQLIDFSTRIAQAGLEPGLVELVKIRASQINGCAMCLHFHLAEAHRHGVTDEQIIMLDGWRESPLFSQRERAALAWTEALTLLTQTRAPDDVYEIVRAQFTEKEQVTLTLMIANINSFNRLGVGFRVAPPAPGERRAA